MPNLPWIVSESLKGRHLHWREIHLSNFPVTIFSLKSGNPTFCWNSCSS